MSQYQEAHNNHIQLLNALAESSRLMLENKRPSSIVSKVLALIGKAALADRAYLYKNIYENGKLNILHCVHEWYSSDANIELHVPKVLSWDTLGGVKDTLPYGLKFVELTKNITYELHRKSLELQGTKSIILMPIFTDFIFWGFIGIEDCTNERIWDETALITISSVAASIGIFLQRNELEKELLVKQEEISAQNQFFNNIFNQLPADLVIFSPDQKYLFVNKQGVPNDETRKWIIGKTDYEYCLYRKKPLSIADSRRAIFEKVKKSLEVHSFEEEYDLPNGQKKYHLRYMVPVTNNNKELEFMLGYGLDITNLKQKEILIKKQNVALENAPIGIALLNSSGEYYYMNKTHADVFEYQADEVIGKSWKTVYDEEESSKIESQYFPLLMKEGKWHGETEGITKSGRKITQEIALQLFSDGDMVCITKDMTETKEELFKVQKIVAQLEMAMKATNLGMWTYDLISGMVEINEASYVMLDLSRNDTPQFTIDSWVERIYEEDRRLIMSEVNKHIENFNHFPQNVYQAEYRIRKNDGSYIWVLGVGKVSKTDNLGKPTEMTGFTFNINEQKQLDEKVKQGDKKYRDLVESLKEIIFQTDLEGKFSFLNKSWETITNFEIDQTLHQDLLKFVHLDDKGKVIKIFKDLVLETTDCQNNVVKFINKDKETIWLDFHVSLHKDINGNKLGIIGSAENITARVIAEKELLRNKEILNKIINSIDDVIWSYDLKKKEITFISPSCKRMTGINDVDFYNKNHDWYDFVSPEHLPLIKESDDALMAQKIEERDIVYQMEIGKPAQIKWVRDKAKLCYNELGKPVRVDGITFDITSVVLAEENLKLSEEKYRLISENIQDIVTILDSEGNIEYMSPSAYRLPGFSKIPSNNDNLFEFVHPDSMQEVRYFLNNLLPNTNNQIIFKIKTANDKPFWVESIVTVLGTANVKTLLQASTRDVTAKILAEQELTKALEKEKELSMLKSRFVSMASHEFRTPLSTIRTGTELIKLFIDKEANGLSTRIYGKVNEKISEILLDIDRISNLMTDILTMGKVEASRIPFNPNALCVNDFINEYIQVDAHKILNKRKVILQIPTDPIYASLDKRLITQVLQNGISNAVKYSAEDKPIEITLNKAENNVVISIKDNGIGIPESELPLVFESFFRSTNADNIPGTGLGMAIIKLFIEMHKGTVSITSTIHVGTTLTITLPIVYNEPTLNE
jgi:PAS domain S-box-containing protein